MFVADVVQPQQRVIESESPGFSIKQGLNLNHHGNVWGAVIGDYY